MTEIQKRVVQTAKDLAVSAHAGQTYGGRRGHGQPYTIHLQNVVDVLMDFAVDDYEMLAAAWIHDVFEDTDTGYLEVVRSLGTRIVDLAITVTNPVDRLMTRKDKHRVSYPKIRLAGEKAVMVKLADRIANTEECRRTEDARLKMYRREFAEFEKVLYREGECDTMWERLRKCTEEPEEDTGK